MTILPVFIFVAYFDQSNGGAIWETIYATGAQIFDAIKFVGSVFLFLLGIASVVIMGVGAGGRLRGAPIPDDEDLTAGPDMSLGVFLLGLFYVLFFAIFYAFDIEIGNFSLGNFSPLTNAILFAAPVWTAACISKHEAESRGAST